MSAPTPRPLRDRATIAADQVKLAHGDRFDRCFAATKLAGDLPAALAMLDELSTKLARAADEVHAEARYQLETARRIAVNPGGRGDQWHIDRLLMVERIIRTLGDS